MDDRYFNWILGGIAAACIAAVLFIACSGEEKSVEAASDPTASTYRPTVHSHGSGSNDGFVMGWLLGRSGNRTTVVHTSPAPSPRYTPPAHTPAPHFVPSTPSRPSVSSPSRPSFSSGTSRPSFGSSTRSSPSRSFSSRPSFGGRR